MVEQNKSPPYTPMALHPLKSSVVTLPLSLGLILTPAALLWRHNHALHNQPTDQALVDRFKTNDWASDDKTVHELASRQAAQLLEASAVTKEDFDRLEGRLDRLETILLSSSRAEQRSEADTPNKLPQRVLTKNPNVK